MVQCFIPRSPPVGAFVSARYHLVHCFIPRSPPAGRSVLILFFFIVVFFQPSPVRPCNRPTFCSRFAVRYSSPVFTCSSAELFFCLHFGFALRDFLPVSAATFFQLSYGPSHRPILYSLRYFFSVSYPVSRLLDLTGGVLLGPLPIGTSASLVSTPNPHLCASSECY